MNLYCKSKPILMEVETDLFFPILYIEVKRIIE